MPNDETMKEDVRRLNKAVFGDTNNPKETPGIVAELAQMNSTLTDMRDALRKINWLLITAFISALVALVIKSPTP